MAYPTTFKRFSGDYDAIVAQLNRIQAGRGENAIAHGKLYAEHMERVVSEGVPLARRLKNDRLSVFFFDLYKHVGISSALRELCIDTKLRCTMWKRWLRVRPNPADQICQRHTPRMHRIERDFFAED
jgi:hypothetical protein